MYQETLVRNKNSRSDIVLFALVIVLIICAEFIVRLSNVSTSVFVAVARLVMFLLFVACCALIYYKRIRSFRYSICVEEEFTENGEPIAVGTIAFEQCVGNAGSVIEVVTPDEFIRVAPTVDVKADIAVCKSRLRATNRTRAESYMLFFERENQSGSIEFHPSDEMLRYIGELLPGKLG